MKQTFKTFLNEQNDPSKKKTETQDKTKGMEDTFNRSMFGDTDKGQVEPIKQPNKPSGKPQQKKQLKTASGETTARKVGNIQPSEEMIRKFSQMNLPDEDIISDEEARRNAGVEARNQNVNRVPTDDGEIPIPVKPQTLPAVISKSLVKAGEVTPEWHMVKHLPGYLSAGIRAIGRAVFAPFTRTPIEQIQVIANLQGQGPNEDRELNAVAQYLRDHATRDREAEIIFHDRIPDYGADIKVFKTENITFMMVKDFAGHYIYAWPTSDEKQIGQSNKSLK